MKVKKKKKRYKKPEIREEKIVLTVEAQISQVPFRGFQRPNRSRSRFPLWAVRRQQNRRVFPRN